MTINKRVFFAFFIALFLLLNNSAIAEVNSSDVLKKRAELENDLKNLEKEINGYTDLIQEKQRESTTLERDIAIIDAKVQKAKLEIKARNLSIQKLLDGINDNQKTITVLSKKIEREKTSLAELLRKYSEMDKTSLVELVLGYENFSDFFVDVGDFESIQTSLQNSFDEINYSKEVSTTKIIELNDKKEEEMALRNLQELEKQRAEQSENEKKKILKATKGKEAEYQKMISNREKDAAAIRSQLFILTGSANIPFEKAVELANLAYKATNVRPAFLLGIITEESNLGANVGTGNWKTDMHPTRDRPIFEKITAKLGLDPNKMPVSKKPWYGWGGAMGPAQFIPSTWVLYEDKIAQLTGHSIPNPWDPYDAFMASAILLKDNGGAGGNYAKERLAALRYLAGWKNANKKAYAFYGDDVMEFAAKYQRQIDIIQKN